MKTPRHGGIPSRCSPRKRDDELGSSIRKGGVVHLRHLRITYNMSDLEKILRSAQRKLVVAKDLPDLSRANTVFILFVEEGRGAAGGRAAGYGSRTISRVIGFRLENGSEAKFFDTSDPSLVRTFEVPYSATAMDIVLRDGSVAVVSGIVDPELVQTYLACVERTSGTQ
jgi:hypothetical protein